MTYWAGPTAKDHDREKVAHLASDQFGEAGVAAGASLYVINYVQGGLRVVTAMTIGKLLTQDQAEQELRGSNL